MNQVSQYKITNVTEKANLINQYRTTLIQLIATFAQIFGGIAVGIGIIFAWGNFITAKEGQITERFTRAIDQLGSQNLEIRLGGIVSLERISNESNKDHWSIMEILAAYVRNNSSVYAVRNKNVIPISMDIQAEESTKNRISDTRRLPVDIQKSLTIIGSHNTYTKPNIQKIFFALDLRDTYLQWAILSKADFELIDLMGADLKNALLREVNLKGAFLVGANFQGAILQGANLQGVNLQGAILQGANLQGANLKGVKELTIDQLSKVRTLYNAKLDDELLIPLKEKYPALFEKPNT